MKTRIGCGIMRQTPLRPSSFMKRLVFSAIFLAACSISTEAEDLLSYWNFNNCTPGAEGELGKLRTEPALYGEAFDESTRRLSSNTNFNTVFHGENIYIDLSSLSGTYGGSISGGWGVFTDTRANKLKPDDSAGGSLMSGAINDANGIVFVLSTEGYRNLQVTYAHRANDAASVEWAYSLDGTNYTPFAEVNKHTAFAKETLNLSGPGGLGLKQLDDQKSIYLRATLLYPGKPSGNLAFDNFQLTGER